MKPLFVCIKSGGELTAAINTQDIKTIFIDQKGGVCVQLSEESAELDLSEHQVTRLRKEIRDRYDVIKIKDDGSKISRSSESHYRRDRKKNAVIEVHTADGTLIIFPKALNSITAKDGSLIIKAYGTEDTVVPVPSNFDLEYDGMSGDGVMRVAA